MALSASALGALIAQKMKEADTTITVPEMVDTFANAIAAAIVQHLTAAGTVTIQPTTIVTTGGPASQSGPQTPLILPLQ